VENVVNSQVCIFLLICGICDCTSATVPYSSGSFKPLPDRNSSESSSSHRIMSVFLQDSGYGCSVMARLVMPVTMSVDGIVSTTSWYM
jgi:hypothetical protein